VLHRSELAASASYTLPANTPVQQYLTIPLQIPPAGINPAAAVYNYTGANGANDASIGDLDGDGEYEIILKWDPSDSKTRLPRVVLVWLIWMLTS